MENNYIHNYSENRKSNLVIITKNIRNFDNKNNSQRNLITYQSGDFSYKLSINSSKITHNKILKTISSMKKQFESKKDEYLNSHKNDNNEKTLIKEEINNEIISELDYKLSHKVSKKSLRPIDFKKKIGGSVIAVINKTNSDLDNEFESKNKKISKCNSINKIIAESNDIQEENPKKKIENKDNNEEIIDNNGSVHECFTYNVGNNKNNIISNNITNNNINQIKIYNNNFIIYNNNYYICNNVNNVEINNEASNRKLKNEKFADNISENKNLINIPNNNNLFFSKKILSSKLNDKKEIGINTFNHQQKKVIENDNIENNPFIGHIKCFICDRDYLISRLYSAECKKHYICRKCLKNFYEDKIENIYFIKDDSSLKCPCENCDAKINFDILKNKISDRHIALYLEKVNNNIKNVKNNILNEQNQNDENIKLYTQKHVIDINSNKNFFLYNKAKDIYCKKCLKPTLFTKTNTNFIICLNCRYKMCKFCLKEYQDKHTDIKTNNHCKVYYKRNELFLKKNKMNTFITVLLQYIFTIAIFIIMILGTLYNIIHIMKIIFCIDDTKEKNIKRNINCCWYVKYSLVLVIGIIIYIIILPFMLISFPFFPVLISVLD